ncbi:cytochrome P450 [Spongiactinospora sp. TRM90649]|uniref:cytochrome P450 n=1 Tax=Spongiactinospora sp. TRM90649 TaxID=3031114 RepID=UPI0023F6FE51|nr:cytochrome P450 [Spongiactinospora sp. TRM90649]MDF5755682.1 cytochrome P450 [Spongiactinospora sp. TRM90649]
MPSPPPGPRKSVFRQTYRFLRDPMGLFGETARRHGPIFTLRYLGFPPEVYITTAELAERVYALDGDGGGRAGQVRKDFMEPVVGRHSLLSLDGEPWRRHRKLLSPPLHGRAISGYRDEITRITLRALDTWPTDEPFRLRDRMQEITLEVIIRLVFGINDAARFGRLRTLLPRLIDESGSSQFMMLPVGLRERMTASPLLRRVPYLATTRVAVLREAVDALLHDEISQRRAAPVEGATDVLSRLLAARDADGEPMTDQEIRDELITMLLAGHETTATGLAWTFERLVRDSRVLDRLRADLAAGGDEYLDAVIKEALRSRPVVYEAPRLLDRPLAIGGHEIPAGWYVAPLIALIHRDPTAFPDPDEFRPERFLPAGEGRDEEAAERARRSWMPFGGGRRYCVGAQLALLEMRVIIREVLNRFDLEAPAGAGPEAVLLKSVTLMPGDRARVIARARTAVPAR